MLTIVTSFDERCTPPEAPESTSSPSERCGRCGREPAEGYAAINDVRYCHGDMVDEHGDTCYERTALLRGQSAYLRAMDS